MLGISFIGGVLVVEFLNARWLPFIDANQDVFEDLLSIDINKTTIAFISDTSSIVTLSNEELKGLPLDFTLDIVWVGHQLSDSSHIGSDGVLANLVVGVIERVRDIPTESLELLTFSEHGVEPGQTEHSFSEGTVISAQGEVLGLIRIKKYHVGLDTAWWLLGELERALQEGNREIWVRRGRQEQSEGLLK